MPKCPKVKNPCKICLGAVSQKNGLQCCGACESWLHYNCLNYTPGRIKDIKAGIIRVTCPCPDCKTSQPKEYRTDEPFSCTNLQCPANKPPSCANDLCPSNTYGLEKQQQTPVSCPLGACSMPSCKQHSSPNLAGVKMSQKPCSPKAQVFVPLPMGSSSDACLDFSKCKTGCVPSTPASFGGNSPVSGLPSIGAMEQMCNTVGLLSKQIKEIMTKMQSAQGSGGCKLQSAPQGGCGGTTGCPTKSGPRSNCPKPCYCPSNPGK